MGRTLAFLTKFERAELIGLRAKQIEAGSETTLSPGDIPSGGDTHAIAEAEVVHRCIPMRLKRPLATGEFEDVDPNTLQHMSFY